MERFKSHLGESYDPEYLCSLSDEELAEKIRSLPEWDVDLNRDLCWRAGMIEEWEAADGDSFEEVVQAAAEKLGVKIY